MIFQDTKLTAHNIGGILQIWELGLNKYKFNFMMDTTFKKLQSLTFTLLLGIWNHRNIKIRFLTHWGRVAHKYVSKLTTIGSGRHQIIIWTNAAILFIVPFRTNYSEMLIDINISLFNKMHLKLCILRNGGHFVSAFVC